MELPTAFVYATYEMDLVTRSLSCNGRLLVYKSQMVDRVSESDYFRYIAGEEDVLIKDRVERYVDSWKLIGVFLKKVKSYRDNIYHIRHIDMRDITFISRCHAQAALATPEVFRNVDLS